MWCFLLGARVHPVFTAGLSALTSGVPRNLTGESGRVFVNDWWNVTLNMVVCSPGSCCIYLQRCVVSNLTGAVSGSSAARHQSPEELHKGLCYNASTLTFAVVIRWNQATCKPLILSASVKTSPAGHRLKQLVSVVTRLLIFSPLLRVGVLSPGKAVGRGLGLRWLFTESGRHCHVTTKKQEQKELSIGAAFALKK